MRRIVLCATAAMLGLAAPAPAATIDYQEAAESFDQSLSVDARITAQIFLIAAGYSNAVPTEHFTRSTLKALVAFQAANGFVPDGMLSKEEVARLIEQGAPRLSLWGFRKIAYPGRTIGLWVPEGLGLDVKQNGSGLHFRDPRGRLSLDMVSLAGKDVVDVYNGLLGDKRRDGSDVHYSTFKDGENWFVVSSTSPDGADHYYRYHQDGDSVTGFALEWNNAVENINAERIAVILSGALRAAMLGSPYVDPPAPGAAPQAAAPPATVPATVPVAPAPPTPPKETYSTGTGFYVAPDGSLVTNAHVVDGCSDIMVKSDDGTVSAAERVATDATNDLALLKVATSPKHIVLLRVGTRLGEGVEAFGFPHSDLLSSSGNFTMGNVTALTGVHDDSRYVQISVPVQAGNSGGPLLDASGNLVGVVAAKLDAIKIQMADGDLPQNVNFAVKSAMVANFLDANRVAYKTGPAGAAALAPADVADLARSVSAFVACR